MTKILNILETDYKLHFKLFAFAHFGFDVGSYSDLSFISLADRTA